MGMKCWPSGIHMDLIIPLHKVLFPGWIVFGKWIFGIALILMILSMAISLRELQISVGALDLLLSELEEGERAK